MSNLDNAATVERVKHLYLQHTDTIERLQAVNNDLFYGRSLPEEKRDELRAQLAELDEKEAALDRQIKEATPAAEAAADALWAAGEYERFFLTTGTSGPAHRGLDAEAETRADEIGAEAVERHVGVEVVPDSAAESVSVSADKAEPVVERVVKVEPVASTAGYSTPGYSTSGYSTPGYSAPGYSAASYEDDDDVYVDDDEDVDAASSSLRL